MLRYIGYYVTPKRNTVHASRTSGNQDHIFDNKVTKAFPGKPNAERNWNDVSAVQVAWRGLGRFSLHLAAVLYRTFFFSFSSKYVIKCVSLPTRPVIPFMRATHATCAMNDGIVGDEKSKGQMPSAELFRSRLVTPWTATKSDTLKQVFFVHSAIWGHAMSVSLWTIWAHTATS